jgi:hypothetical protein
MKKIIAILIAATALSITQNYVHANEKHGSKVAYVTNTLSFTPTAVGWYRITSYAIVQGGRIEISANYDNRVTDVEFQYNMGTWGIGGSIQQTRYSSYNLGCVDQIRISGDGGPNSYLDIHVSSAASPGVISIVGSGASIPSFVSSPVVGATAGTGFVSTLTLGHGFNTTGAVSSYGGSAAWMVAPSISLYYDKAFDRGMIYSWHPSVDWKPLQLKAASFSFLSYDLIQGLYQDASGKVGIGTITPDAKLTVNGAIHSKEVKVDMDILPDYVFDKNYNLPSLKQVQKYINQYHHLPDVPSAAEVAKDGLKLGEMNAILLKKVEELTLYLLEKDKEVKELQKRLLIIEQKQ